MTGHNVLIVLLLSTGCCWAGKLCCDRSCSEVISYGTTITRHISKQPDYLSFPRNALIEVYAKHDDPDVWLVKYGNKKGFVARMMILEKTITCEELIHVDDEKEATEESIDNEQVNNNSPGDHSNQELSDDPVIVATDAPVDNGSDGEFADDIGGEDGKETSESIPAIAGSPTGTIEEKEMLEKYVHDDVSHSPTLPPQVDLHDSEKPVEQVEPAKQDIYNTDNKPELDDDEGEDVFEFNTEEEFEHWSDHMRSNRDHMMGDRAHMINEEMYKHSDEQIINKDNEGYHDKDEEDENDNDHKETEHKMDNDYSRVEELERVPEEREHEEEKQEEENKEYEEEDKEEYEEEDWKAQQTGYKQNDEEEMLEKSSGIGHEEETNVEKLAHTTSPDLEQHQDYLPSDMEPPTVSNEEYHDDDDDDPKFFEKIAEELAAAADKQKEQEKLDEKELNGNTEQEDDLESSEILPVTIVTDTLDVNPSTTHDDHINTATSVVMATATVDSGEVSADENRQEDNHDEVNEIPDSDEETFKEDIETNEAQEKKGNDEIPEIQEKYEQEDLNNSEISETQQIHEQAQHGDSEILETPKIPEKEMIENDKIQSTSDLEHKTDDSHETEDIRSDEAQKDDEVYSEEEGEKHGIEEEEDKGVPQQTGNDGVKQIEEEVLKDEDMDEDLEKQTLDELQREAEDTGDNLEKQRLEGKDKAEDLEKDEQRREDEKQEAEDKQRHEDEKQEAEEENDRIHEQEKPSDSIQPSQEYQQQPSVTDHPHSVTVVEKPAAAAATTATTTTSTLVDMATHDVPIPIPTSSILVASTSVSMTTDDGHDSKMEERDSYDVLEEKTVEVMHKPVIGHQDDSMRDTDRQSEDQAESEEHIGTRRTTIVSLLPSFLAVMLMDVDDNVVYMLMGTLAAILLPCCVMSCRSSIKSNRQRRELENMKARYRSAEEQIGKLEEEKNQLSIKFNTELGKCRSVEELLSGEKQNVMLLQQANKEANELLMSKQTELQQYHVHNDQLVGELTTEKQLHATQIAATQDAQQEIMNTRAHLQQVSQRVTELEATKDQLEQEVFTTKQNSDELQAAHLKLQQSHDEVTQRCGNLDEQLASIRSNLETAESLVKEKDDELKLLRECLLQLQSDESDEEVVKETESNAQRKVLTRKNSKIEKVHAMLDTTKVQTELKSVKEERRSLQEELGAKSHTLQQLEGELEETKNKLTQLQSEQDELSLQHAETEIKLKTLTEYFENKEQNLHRKLGVEEAARQEIENREATAMEKVTMAEEERAKERVELQQLRQQMSEIEKSLMQQVVTNDKRAQEALAQLRRTEQELRVANREISDLKKRLSGSRPTSPGGSETGRPPSHPPMLRQRYSPPPERYHEPVPVRRRPPSTGPRMETRPLSAPRFPRTSSPEIDLTHHPPVSGRQHNDTYPGPSRPIPQPHPPRDSYSLDDRDRMVMRGPDEMKSLPPPPLHHHPRLPPQKSYDRMDRPVPMSDRPPLPQSLSDHHPLPPRLPPPGPRGDPSMMSSRRPPLYHHQPPPGPTRPLPPHEAFPRRPGPPTTHNRQQQLPSFDSTEPPKPSDQHKMEV